jgi:hypothetical protein
VLISETYRALNKRLHEDNPAYGTSGGLSAEIVAAMERKLGAASILDYGCGKMQLQAALGFRIENYDPAISGYDAAPSPADIVVCSDVLEHIEPECLDDVLRDLVRVTNRAIYAAPSCVPARKFLVDGRNAHLIVRDADWWLEKLSVHFRMARFFTTEGGCVFIGQALRDVHDFPDMFDIGPPLTMTTITCKPTYTSEQRCANIRSAMLRGFSSVQSLTPHKKTMIIAGYGPSLKDTLPELSDDIAKGGDLYTTSGAHGFLLKRRIVPVGHIEIDPRPHKAVALGETDARIAYFLASVCSREMFDAVHGREIYLIHAHSSDGETSLIRNMDPGALIIDMMATTVGLAAISIGMTLGYRRFSIYGMDCSFEVDKEFLNWPRDKDFSSDVRGRVACHAGPHPNEDQPIYRVWVGNRPFVTSPQLLQSAQDYMMLTSSPLLKWCGFKLHGPGFLANLERFVSLRDRRAA